MVENPPQESEQENEEEAKEVQHDLFFRSLISDFFPQFIELFFPDLSKDVEWKEVSPAGTVTVRKLIVKDRKRERKEKRVDLTERVESKTTGKKFLIHVEIQERTNDLKSFPSRMFNYCSRLLEANKFELPVFPIALLSFADPKQEQPSNYEVQCQGKHVISFQYEVIQLNRLRWQDFAHRPNPVAIALSAKMPIADNERVNVLLICLKALDRLQLEDDQREDIVEFIETYLELTPEEESALRARVVELSRQGEVIPMVTSWKREAKAEGRAEGRAEEARLLVKRLLQRRFGIVPAEISPSIEKLPLEVAEQLAEDLLELSCLDDLVSWLGQNQSGKDKDDSSS